MLLVLHVAPRGHGKLGSGQCLLAVRCVQGSRHVETTLTYEEPRGVLQKVMKLLQKRGVCTVR